MKNSGGLISSRKVSLVHKISRIINEGLRVGEKIHCDVIAILNLSEL